MALTASFSLDQDVVDKLSSISKLLQKNKSECLRDLINQAYQDLFQHFEENQVAATSNQN